MKTIVLLVGVSGSGKSTILTRLADSSIFHVLQPTTTRPPRPGEKEYEHIEKSSWKKASYQWAITARQNQYGMRKSRIDDIPVGKIGLSVFHPGNIAALQSTRDDSHFEIITVGLNTVFSYEEQLARINGDSSRDEGSTEFLKQQKVVEDCDVVLSGTISSVESAVFTIGRLLSHRGVIDGDAIRSLIIAGTLLKESDEKQIQSASYDLRVGDTIWCKGVLKGIGGEPVSIPPYSYVIIAAAETATLPRFVTAHYDVKVSLFLRGVLLSNGPQVDPGYKGLLLCLLFNSSDSNVGLRKGEHFATLEFHTTSKVTKGYKQNHQEKGKLLSFMDDDTSVKSGGTIVDQFIEIKRDWEKFKTAIFIALIGAVVAVATLTFTAFREFKAVTDVRTQLDRFIEDARLGRSQPKAVEPNLSFPDSPRPNSGGTTNQPRL